MSSWKRYLRKKGVELSEGTYDMFLECLTCGHTWALLTPPRGKRNPRGYWHCPNGCNSE